MIKQDIQNLKTAKSRVALLEAKIAKGLERELPQLPGKYGFETAGAFIEAVRSAAGGRKAGRPSGHKDLAGKRRPRAVVTDETRQAVKKLVQEHKTGVAIAKALKISLPTVQNIKKALGLVRKHG